MNIQVAGSPGAKRISLMKMQVCRVPRDARLRRRRVAHIRNAGTAQGVLSLKQEEDNTRDRNVLVARLSPTADVWTLAATRCASNVHGKPSTRCVRLKRSRARRDWWRQVEAKFITFLMCERRREMTFSASTTLHRWLFCHVERRLRLAPAAAFDRLSHASGARSARTRPRRQVRSACSAVTTLTGIPNRSMR